MVYLLNHKAETLQDNLWYKMNPTFLIICVDIIKKSISHFQLKALSGGISYKYYIVSVRPLLETITLAVNKWDIISRFDSSFTNLEFHIND